MIINLNKGWNTISCPNIENIAISCDNIIQIIGLVKGAGWWPLELNSNNKYELISGKGYAVHASDDCELNFPTYTIVKWQTVGNITSDNTLVDYRPYEIVGDSVIHGITTNGNMLFVLNKTVVVGYDIRENVENKLEIAAGEKINKLTYNCDGSIIALSINTRVDLYKKDVIEHGWTRTYSIDNYEFGINIQLNRSGSLLALAILKNGTDSIVCIYNTSDFSTKEIMVDSFELGGTMGFNDDIICISSISFDLSNKILIFKLLDDNWVVDGSGIILEKFKSLSGLNINDENTCISIVLHNNLQGNLQIFNKRVDGGEWTMNGNIVLDNTHQFQYTINNNKILYSNTLYDLISNKWIGKKIAFDDISSDGHAYLINNNNTCVGKQDGNIFKIFIQTRREILKTISI